jgi:hypothetical protein
VTTNELHEAIARRFCDLHGIDNTPICELGLAAADAALAVLSGLPMRELISAIPWTRPT